MRRIRGSGVRRRFATGIISAVARFVEKKAPDIILRAFAMVLDRCAEAWLIMMGDGPLLEECRQLARSLEVSHAVRFAGPRPHLEVAEAMIRLALSRLRLPA